MNFSKKQSHKKSHFKTLLEAAQLSSVDRFPWPDAHNNQVDIKKEQGLWKLLGTSECNCRYACLHSRELKKTVQRVWESWMDGVQWRHCLSDAAIILFPLGGKEQDTLWIRQRRLSNITEHHQRHDGGEPLLALRLLNVVSFRLRRLNRIPHFMRSSKNVLQLNAETVACTAHRK